MDWSTRDTQRSKCIIWTPSTRTQSKWNFIVRGICLFHFLCTAVRCQCLKPNPSLTSVLETDPAGTVAFNVSAVGVTWWYKMSDPNHSVMREYLNFSKNGDLYFMTLTKPLDLEELYEQHGIDESGFPMTLTCREAGKPDRDYDILIFINPVNEYAPIFNTSNINVYVNETDTVPVRIVNLSDWASDADYNPVTTEINGYRILDPINPKLGIRSTDGGVFTTAALDFEELPKDQKYLKVEVLVKDSGGKNATASLTIHVADVDDLPPRFTYTGCRSNCDSILYSATFSANVTGKLMNVQPAAIYAEDGDALASSIIYTIAQGPPGYQEYISLNPTTGEVFIQKPLVGLQSSDLVFTIQAQENSTQRNYARTTLLISVQGSSGSNTPLAAASAAKDDVMIVTIVLGITIFVILVILIVAMIYFRKRYKKAVHPHSSKDPKEETPPAERASNTDGRTVQERPRTMTFTEDEMKVDEEITAWLPGNNLSDIVDLSDEDTIKRRRKNGKPPSSTQMTSRDSAFEESSDKKSGSEDSHKDTDPDFDPVTEYAEVGVPSECRSVTHTKAADHVYVPDPTTIDQKSKENHNTTDSGVDEAEYLSPNSTRVKLQNNANKAHNTSYKMSGTDLDSSTYSDLISVDGNGMAEDTGAGGISGSVEANVERMERERKDYKSHQKMTHRLNKSTMSNRQSPSDDEADEITEYSTPRSDRVADTNDTRRVNEERKELLQQPVNQSSQLSLAEPTQLPAIVDDDDRPEVPPRPKIRQTSGLKVLESNKNSNDEIQYASVQKKSDGNLKSSCSKKEKSLNNNHDPNMSIEESSNVIEPPMRRKRRKRSKQQVKAPEEDVYDGTKDYEDLEMDPEFYLDTNKTRIKRSTRIPAVQPDPDDTRYWITVASEH